jgi:nucleoside-diphosphate-sugar epimerase
MTDLFSHDVTIYWIRVFYAFGPHQRATSLIPSALARLAAGGEPEVKNPDRLVDLIHVDDLADIFLALMKAPAPAGVYNAGSGQPRLVGDVVELLSQVWNNEAVEECPVVKDPTRGSWADMSKTNQVIAPRPSTSLVDFFRVEATQMQRKLQLSRR